MKAIQIQDSLPAPSPTTVRLGRDIRPSVLETAKFPIHLESYGFTINLDVPRWPLDHPGIRTRSWMDFLDDHLAWKKTLHPHKDEAKQRKDCISELKVFESPFAGIEDRDDALAITAYAVFICLMDDYFEDIHIDNAQDLTSRVCAALQVDKALEPEMPDNELDASGVRYAKCLRARMLECLRPRGAEAALASMREFAQKQLREKIFLHNNGQWKSIEHYFDIRDYCLGVMPSFTILEHLYLSPDEPVYEDVHRLKLRLKSLCAAQNDLGGIERDFAKGNRVNIVRALGEIHGREVLTGEDVCRNRDLVDEAVKINDELCRDVVQIVDEIYSKPISEGKAKGVEKIFALALTHLQWTLSVARYAVKADATDRTF